MPIVAVAKCLQYQFLELLINYTFTVTQTIINHKISNRWTELITVRNDKGITINHFKLKSKRLNSFDFPSSKQKDSYTVLDSIQLNWELENCSVGNILVQQSNALVLLLLLSYL